MKEVCVNIEKSPIPIIWLDTSIIFDITLWKENHSLSEVKKRRARYLFSNIYDLVRQNKLICPYADQTDEIWIGRDKCIKIIQELSLGIRAKYSESIKDIQTLQFMQSFLEGTLNIDIKYDQYFQNDPIQELNNTTNITINVDFGLLEDSDTIKKRKERLLGKVEEIRKRNVANGVKYDCFDSLGNGKLLS